jgi:hypothetical protein
VYLILWFNEVFDEKLEYEDKDIFPEISERSLFSGGGDTGELVGEETIATVSATVLVSFSVASIDLSVFLLLKKTSCPFSNVKFPIGLHTADILDVFVTIKAA